MDPQIDLAIVLKLTEFSETSQIVTLLGQRHGQIRLIAKGARRSTRKRFAAGLDLLELGEVGFLLPRGDAQLGTLTDWQQRDAFMGLRRAALPLAGALYAIELVAGLTEEHDPHPELFVGLRDTMHSLSSNEPPAGPIIVQFQMIVLKTIGYAPELGRCIDCGRPPASNQPTWFTAGGGGLLCRDCEPHHQEKRRMPTRPERALDDPAESPRWFDLLDYQLTFVAGRKFKTAARVTALLARKQQP